MRDWNDGMTEVGEGLLGEGKRPEVPWFYSNNQEITLSPAIFASAIELIIKVIFLKELIAAFA